MEEEVDHLEEDNIGGHDVNFEEDGGDDDHLEIDNSEGDDVYLEEDEGDGGYLNTTHIKKKPKKGEKVKRLYL